MVRPIFIGGGARTGTTWLANIISRHSKVACIQGTTAAGMDGVNESAFFSHVAGMFGNLENDNNLIQLIEVFASSAYFVTSGLDKNIFYRERPRTYQDFFRLLMDRFAEKKDADLWLEKTPAHSLHFEEIVSYYNDAKIIAIKRDPVDQIRSGVMLRKRMIGEKNFILNKINILARLLKYHSSYKYIGHLMSKKPDKVMLIEYEELQKSTKSIITKICNFLEIEFEEDMLGDRDNRKSNTSFISDSERDKVLSSVEKRGVQFFSYLLNLVPYQLYRLIYLVKRSIYIKRRKLPFWFFNTKIKQYGWSKIFRD